MSVEVLTKSGQQYDEARRMMLDLMAEHEPADWVTVAAAVHNGQTVNDLLEAERPVTPPAPAAVAAPLGQTALRRRIPFYRGESFGHTIPAAALEQDFLGAEASLNTQLYLRAASQTLRQYHVIEPDSAIVQVSRDGTVGISDRGELVCL